jgi:hypothetical protein
VSLRGSIGLAAGAASARVAPTNVLWLVAIELWLRRLPATARRNAVRRSIALRREVERQLRPPVAGDEWRFGAWADALTQALAPHGTRADAVALWCAVSAWDEAGGRWPELARAVETIAADADSEADGDDPEAQGVAAMETGRAASALRARMDEVGARLWAMEGGR